jgi:hypothetical protein
MPLLMRKTKRSDDGIDKYGFPRGSRSSAADNPKRALDIFLMGTIFVLALVLRIWFNFFDVHVNNYSSCDAAEYLRNAVAMQKLVMIPTDKWIAGLQAIAANDQPALDAAKADFAVVSEMKQSGPIFPLFLIAADAIAGPRYQSVPWYPPLVMQSAVSAATCALIYLCGVLCWGRGVGFVAGIMAAFYPGFIVNSGRLYSETFATFLLTAVMFIGIKCIIEKHLSLTWSLALGVLLMSLQFTRSAMVLFVIVTLLLCLLFTQTKIKTIAGIVIGATVIAAPWLVVQKLSFNAPNLVVNRVGHYNLFIGTNVDTEGFLAFPYPDGRGIEERSYPDLISTAYERSHSRFLKLAGDKVPRLFKTAWNDFRTRIGPISVFWQNIYHQGILVLAMLGFGLATFTQKPPERDLERSEAAITGSVLTARLLLVFSVAIHAAYLLFITVPRYNITAMPALLVLAGAGFVVFFQLLDNERTGMCMIALVVTGGCLAAALFINPVLLSTFVRDQLLVTILIVGAKLVCTVGVLITLLWTISQMKGNRFMASLLSTTVVLLLIPGLCLQVRAHGRPNEWTALIGPGDSISQQLVIPQAKLEGMNGAYLLVDAQGASGLNSMDVWANGRKLDGPRIPALFLLQEGFPARTQVDRMTLEFEDILNYLTISGGTQNSDLRQWFLIPLPPNLIPTGGKLNVTLAARANSVATVNGSTSTEGSILFPGIDHYSWEKAFYGVEDLDGLSDGRYDMRLQMAAAAPDKYTLKRNGKEVEKPGHIFAAVLPVKHGFSSDAPSKHSLKSLNGFALNAAQPTHSELIKLDTAGVDRLCMVRIRGTVTARGEAHPGLQVKVRNAGGTEGVVYESPWAPSSLSTKQARFDYTVPIPQDVFSSRPVAAELVFTAKNRLWQSLNIKPSEPGQVEFSDIQIEVLRHPLNPLSASAAQQLN